MHSTITHPHLGLFAHVPSAMFDCCCMPVQVQNADGVWMDVTAPRGTVTVLAGYTLERATCGLIKASNHRVVRSND